jgi:hypothetical protein
MSVARSVLRAANALNARSAWMKTSHWFASAIGAAALGFLAMPVQAAPAGALTGNAAAAQVEGASTPEQVRHRCYRRYGEWICPRHHYYRSYGYGPGVSLYFGGRRHHHHRRHW